MNAPSPDPSLYDLIDDYWHGLLVEPQRSVLEARAAEDESFRHAFEEGRKRLEAMQSLPPLEPSDKLLDGVLERVNRYETRRKTRMRYLTRGGLAAAAAVACILLGFQVYFYNLRPTPYDLRLLTNETYAANSTAYVRLAVFDHGRDRFREGVPVELSLVQQNQIVPIGKGTIDSASEPIAVKLPDVAAKGKYVLRAVATIDGRRETVDQTVTITRPVRLLVSSDKPIYQPGQTIHLRALALSQSTGKPLDGEPMTFLLRDPKGNLIFKQAEATSRFGIAAANCPLAHEVMEGPYQLECVAGPVHDPFVKSEHTIEVFRYVLPKFKIEIEPNKTWYSPGEELEGKLTARYFFGEPVRRGQARLELIDASTGGDAIASQEFSLDEFGAATFQFTLPATVPGRPQDGGKARLQLKATVTDEAEQSETQTAQALVAADPIEVELVPEGGALVPYMENRIFVQATYPDGRPMQGRVTFVEFDRNPRLPAFECTTDELGLGEFKLTVDSAAYRTTATQGTRDLGLIVAAADDAGQRAEYLKRLDVDSPHLAFLLRPDAVEYGAGETITLTALGGGVEPVLIDLVKDGQTLAARTLEMANGRGQLALELPPEISGLVELNAYRFDGAGFAVRRAIPLFVRKADQVKIAAAFDAAEYRPGKSAKVKFQLTDSQGKPAPGALSLAAVDEAVYAVQRRGLLERTFDKLDSETLSSQWVIYGHNPFALLAMEQRLEQSEQQIAARRLWQELTAAREIVNERMKHGAMVEFADTSPVEIMSEAEMWSQSTIPPWEADFRNGETLSSQPPYVSQATYRSKAREVYRTRELALSQLGFFWIVLGVMGGIYAIVLLIMSNVVAVSVSVRSLISLGGVVLVLFVLSALLLSSTKKSLSGIDFAGGVSLEASNLAPATVMETPDAGRWREPMDTIELASDEDPTTSPGAPKPRVRRDFPETLLWLPQLISDDEGQVELELSLADSITTWRMLASAVTANGELGAETLPIKVFQPFFADLRLPVALTRGDEVSVPVVVYNYLDQPQEVTVTLEQADWFETLDNEHSPLTQTIKLAPNQVASLYFPIRVKTIGRQRLQATALAGDVSDALEREIEVVPNGRRIEQLASGQLRGVTSIDWRIPDDAIPGSVQAIVKIYPSTLSEVVEGLDNIFQMPYGCFEQTSSTTYPNVLALDYLRGAGQAQPQVEAKARQYIHLGYQRLLSFEVRGGGFDWYGNPPASRVLTAYGLQQFEDMARVHDVDPQLISRTRKWLLDQQKADGSWEPDRGMSSGGLDAAAERNRRLATTAYIAMAVFHGGKAEASHQSTRNYLLAHPPASIDDPYTLAVVLNALDLVEASMKDLERYAARLVELQETSANGELGHWSLPGKNDTLYYGHGLAGDIEATAMAVLALQAAKAHPDAAVRGLRWLAEQKDNRGTWHSTQATVLTLKAFLSNREGMQKHEGERQIALFLGERGIGRIEIGADQADVLQLRNVSDHFAPGGEYTLNLVDETKSGLGYQLVLAYYVELLAGDSIEENAAPFEVELAYDRKQLAVEETVAVTAKLRNTTNDTLPMVMLDLPIPGGFAMLRDDLEHYVREGSIAKYEIAPRQAIIYLRSLEPKQELTLEYRLRATMPVKVAVPEARAYEYYNPTREATGGAAQLEASGS